jgi:shikimate dehydrogenase
MHNAAFRAAGIDAVYVPFRPQSIKDFFVFAAMLDVVGASVTIPYKVDALTWPSVKADPATLTIGAANTLRRREDGWEATNTDVGGFLDPLIAAVGYLTGLQASVLGAGGAARAVVAGLDSRGVTVTVHARREQQAAAVAAGFSLRVGVGPWPPAPGSWDLLVNCTPLGGAADREASPLPGGPFTGRVVYDLTYGRGDSRLVREARAAGCMAIDGLPMLIAQAERQFEWWTGQRPPAGVMEKAARCI